jgi:hypothetical protein
VRLNVGAKSFVEREIRLRLSFSGAPYPAARGLCDAFNLDYGSTIGVAIKIAAPKSGEMDEFVELYASEKSIDQLLRVLAQKGDIDLYAQLQFSVQDVNAVRARFFGFTVYPWEREPEEDYEDGRYVPPEGKVILLFSKLAS